MNNIYVYRMHTYKTLYFFVFTSYLFLVVNMDNLFRWLNCGYNWWSSQDTFMSKWFHSWWILNDSCPCLKCISFFFFTSRCYFNWLSSSIMRLWLVYNEVWLPRVAAELPKKKVEIYVNLLNSKFHVNNRYLWCLAKVHYLPMAQSCDFLFSILANAQNCKLQLKQVKWSAFYCMVTNAI